jgi:amphi-Trp domain-containing protein
MATDDKFEFESVQDTQSIRDYLQSVIDGIDSGKIVLSTEGNELELHPDSLLKFEVKAKKKGEATKLSIKLSWRQPAAEADSEETISISSE